MMVPQQSDLTGPPPSPIVSVRPIVLPAPRRDVDLEVRVTAPLVGTGLPLVLFAHGFGSHLDAYAPLVDHWAAGGMVVVQATHLDSARLGIAADSSRRADLWRSRVRDLQHLLDEVGTLEAAVPGLAGRVDRGRVVVAGHSFGGQSAGVLVGLRVTDPSTGIAEDLSDPRVTASIQLATAGSGGQELTPFAQEHLPWLRDQDFSHIGAPGLGGGGGRPHHARTHPGPARAAETE
ncbi:chlorophyllase, partial [Streptomyces sp. NPDC047123]|uniref:alpha/beta hydrolase family protein n=1 Tax=Streptomyces sp. NPDC047123 TaxID=3155622 RepID=UPI0034083EB0